MLNTKNISGTVIKNDIILSKVHMVVWKYEWLDTYLSFLSIFIIKLKNLNLVEKVFCFRYKVTFAQ